LSNGLLELLVLSDTHSMQSITQTISSSDLVTALAARRVRACELVFDPGVRRRSRLIIHSRHGLPDLLRWLNDRPERVMALWLDSRHSLGQSVNQTRMPAPAALASTPEAS
jgi:hypothetical protein